VFDPQPKIISEKRGRTLEPGSKPRRKSAVIRMRRPRSAARCRQGPCACWSVRRRRN